MTKESGGGKTLRWSSLLVTADGCTLQQLSRHSEEAGRVKIAGPLKGLRENLCCSDPPNTQPSAKVCVSACRKTGVVFGCF